MRLVVIGGVAAGMSAAAKAKRMDKSIEVEVYEKGEVVSYGACGLPYYVGGFENDYTKMLIRSPEEFERGGIMVHLRHEATAINPDDKSVTIINHETGQIKTVQYDKLMIATGASAILPPFPGAEKEGVRLLKTMDDGRVLHRLARQPHVENVVIVGGGYIGMECADAFLNLGKKVRIIEAAPRLLASFDSELALLAKEELIRHGVQVHLDEKVESFTGEARVEAVNTNKGSYRADLVVVAVGVRPATAFLKGSGIKLAANGAVVVNRWMETTLPDIYAAGDCAQSYHSLTGKNGYLALGTVANKCGRIAGENIAGGNREFLGALGSAAVKVCELEMVRTGLGEEEAKALGLKYKTIAVEDRAHSGYYPGATDIFIKLIYEEASMKILGAQLCGKQGAVLRGNVFATAIQAGMTTTQLGMTDMAYAPPFAGVWDAVHIACNAAK